MASFGWLNLVSAVGTFGLAHRLRDVRRWHETDMAGLVGGPEGTREVGFGGAKVRLLPNAERVLGKFFSATVIRTGWCPREISAYAYI
jgi:hypothetical protein